LKISVKDSASLEERIAALAKKGMIKLPSKGNKLSSFESVSATGKAASEIIIEKGR